MRSETNLLEHTLSSLMYKLYYPPHLSQKILQFLIMYAVWQYMWTCFFGHSHGTQNFDVTFRYFKQARFASKSYFIYVRSLVSDRSGIRLIISSCQWKQSGYSLIQSLQIRFYSSSSWSPFIIRMFSLRLSFLC